jgi:hypothetical protein
MKRGGRLKSGLVIPPSVASVKPPAFVCRVIVDDEGTMCGKQFTDEEYRAFRQHVTRCAKVHLPEIQGRSKRVRMPGLYGPDAFDPEAEKWVRENRQALIEGRKRLGEKRFQPVSRRRKRR